MTDQLLTETFQLKSVKKVWELADSLEKIELYYNLFTVLVFASENRLPFIAKEELLPRLMELSVIDEFSWPRLSLEFDQSKITEINKELRSWLPEEVHLEIENISIGSINISIKGVSDVIKSLSQIFDPLSRKEREEEIRHLKELNMLDEHDKRLETLKKAIDMNIMTQELRRSLDNALPAQVAFDLLNYTIGYAAKVLYDLESDNINTQRLLESPYDASSDIDPDSPNQPLLCPSSDAGEVRENNGSIADTNNVARRPVFNLIKRKFLRRS